MDGKRLIRTVFVFVGFGLFHQPLFNTFYLPFLQMWWFLESWSFFLSLDFSLHDVHRKPLHWINHVITLFSTLVEALLFSRFGALPGLIHQPLVHLTVWVVGSLQHSRSSSRRTAIKIHVWSLLLGQILYRVAFSVLSNTNLPTFSTSSAPVYLK
jgi:hypothetical protein